MQFGDQWDASPPGADRSSPLLPDRGRAADERDRLADERETRLDAREKRVTTGPRPSRVATPAGLSLDPAARESTALLTTKFKATPDKPDAVYARKLQEVLGGQYGEITVAMQCMFQGWNMHLPGPLTETAASSPPAATGSPATPCARTCGSPRRPGLRLNRGPGRALVLPRPSGPVGGGLARFDLLRRARAASFPLRALSPRF